MGAFPEGTCPPPIAAFSLCSFQGDNPKRLLFLARQLSPQAARRRPDELPQAYAADEATLSSVSKVSGLGPSTTETRKTLITCARAPSSPWDANYLAARREGRA